MKEVGKVMGAKLAQRVIHNITGKLLLKGLGILVSAASLVTTLYTIYEIGCLIWDIGHAVYKLYRNTLKHDLQKYLENSIQETIYLMQNSNISLSAFMDSPFFTCQRIKDTSLQECFSSNYFGISQAHMPRLLIFSGFQSIYFLDNALYEKNQVGPLKVRAKKIIENLDEILLHKEEFYLEKDTIANLKLISGNIASIANNIKPCTYMQNKGGDIVPVFQEDLEKKKKEGFKELFIWMGHKNEKGKMVKVPYEKEEEYLKNGWEPIDKLFHPLLRKEIMPFYEDIEMCQEEGWIPSLQREKYENEKELWRKNEKNSSLILNDYYCSLPVIKKK